MFLHSFPHCPREIVCSLRSSITLLFNETYAEQDGGVARWKRDRHRLSQRGWSAGGERHAPRVSREPRRTGQFRHDHLRPVDLYGGVVVSAHHWHSAIPNGIGRRDAGAAVLHRYRRRRTPGESAESTARAIADRHSITGACAIGAHCHAITVADRHPTAGPGASVGR